MQMFSAIFFVRRYQMDNLLAGSGRRVMLVRVFANVSFDFSKTFRLLVGRDGYITQLCFRNLSNQAGLVGCFDWAESLPP